MARRRTVPGGKDDPRVVILLRHSREGGKIAVIPAQAGIQFFSQNGGQSRNGGALRREGTLLDFRLRGNDVVEISTVSAKT
jgi:hypothetical protein